MIKPIFIVKTYSSYNRNPNVDMSEILRRMQEIQREKYRNDDLNNLDNKQYFLINNHAKNSHIYLTIIPLNFFKRLCIQ